VRLLSPAGIYPTGAEFRAEDAAIYLSPKICAVLTKFSPVPHPDQYFYSEVEYLSAFEVRALAAPFLAKKHDTGAVSLYAVTDCYRHGDTSLDLSKMKVLHTLVRGLCESMAEDNFSAAIHLPPCKGGRAYEINAYAEIDRRRLGRLYSND
jgi:hypothetical protein